jgi:hypothetical protein
MVYVPSVAIALCGTLPTGTDPELYPRAAALATRKNIPVFADSYRNFSGLMASGADVFLKINAAELKELSGESSISSGISQLLSMYKNLRFAELIYLCPQIPIRRIVGDSPDARLVGIFLYPHICLGKIQNY